MENFKEYLNNLNENDYLTKVNLHIHTLCSDGKMTPLEVVNYAKEHNFETISICDHNTLEAYLDENVKNYKNIITGIEFDSWHKGVLIHILGYNIDINNKKILSLCAKTKKETKWDIIRLFKAIKRKPQHIIDAIHDAGGIAVLAHGACCWAINMNSFVKSLIDIGLDGLEVYYPYRRHRGIIKFHKADYIKILCEKYNLIKTGGTDAHKYSLF